MYVAIAKRVHSCFSLSWPWLGGLPGDLPPGRFLLSCRWPVYTLAVRPVVASLSLAIQKGPNFVEGWQWLLRFRTWS